MALENVTIFELHFDGAQFGPRELPGGDAVAEQAVEYEPESHPDDEPTGGGRGRVLALVALSVGLSLGAALLARRLAGGAEHVEVETLRDVEATPEQ